MPRKPFILAETDGIKQQSATQAPNLMQTLVLKLEETSQRQTMKIIHLKTFDLIPSENNFYSVDDVKELKTSIELFGVMQNLIVKALGENKYEIISGHRRHKACLELLEEGKTEFEYVPCVIRAPDENQNQETKDIIEQILLIMSNSSTRELSNWEKLRQAERLKEYFTTLKKQENLSGKVRDLVAEALSMSSTQIARLNAINANLTSELKDELKDGNLEITAAYELSALNEEAQKQAHAELKEKGYLSVKSVREIKRPKNSENAKEDFTALSKTEKAERAYDLLKRKRAETLRPEETEALNFALSILLDFAQGVLAYEKKI